MIGNVMNNGLNQEVRTGFFGYNGIQLFGSREISVEERNSAYQLTCIFYDLIKSFMQAGMQSGSTGAL